MRGIRPDIRIRPNIRSIGPKLRGIRPNLRGPRPNPKIVVQILK